MSVSVLRAIDLKRQAKKQAAAPKGAAAFFIRVGQRDDFLLP